MKDARVGHRGRECPSDQDLVHIAQAAPGSAEANRASGELLLRYQDRLYVWCFRYAREHERALDLVQDVMILAHRALPGFEGRSKFSSWLWTITRRRCLREVQRPRLLEDDETDPDSLAAGTARPDVMVEEQEAEEALMALAREHLDTRERTALWLRCFECMGVDAITDTLGIRESSGARGVLQSARRKLREAIARGKRKEEHT